MDNVTGPIDKQTQTGDGEQRHGRNKFAHTQLLYSKPKHPEGAQFSMGQVTRASGNKSSLDSMILGD